MRTFAKVDEDAKKRRVSAAGTETGVTGFKWIDGGGVSMRNCSLNPFKAYFK